MEQLKNTGDKLFNDDKYEEANKYYTQALELDSENKYKIYLNRCLSYYKLKKYKEALSDAINSTKLKPDNAKSWGRLGSCLYVLDKHSQSISAFKKAYELEPTNDNYKKEAVKENNASDTEEEEEEYNIHCDKEDIHCDNIQLHDIKYIKKNIINDKTVDNIINNMLSNEVLINKISDETFQNKILSYQSNPFEILKDKETMSLMFSILKDFSEIK